MKIALVHYSAPPVVGGVESVMGHHARLMADAGHEVAILAGRGEQTDRRMRFIHLPLADSRHAEVLAMKSILDSGQVPAAFEEICQALVSDLNQHLAGWDILIAHNVCSLNKNLALTAALQRLSQEPGAPRLILWHHDLAWTTPRYRDELHAGYPWDLLRTAWAGARQVVVSEARRQELAGLMGLSPAQIQVVPNGVDLPAFYKFEAQTRHLVRALNLLQAAPLLLLPVRITPRKNIELALRCLRILRQDFPQAALVVTGPLGPHNPANRHYFERLVALRRELGLNQAAHFLAEVVGASPQGDPQYLPDAVIADFYRLADALVLPSREEGFGIPILEAGLAGLPVFCAEIPPLLALAGEEGHYFSPDAQPEQVAAQIASVLSASEVYALRCRTRSQYTWEGIYTQRIAPLLEEIPLP